MNSMNNSAFVESDPGDTTLCLDGLEFIQAEGYDDDSFGSDAEDYEVGYDEMDFA